jgi:tetratricopeptide (TPR) repeat protein
VVVFARVAALGRADGWVNLARVYDKEGRLDEAVQALRKAIEHPEPAPAWTVSWLNGRVNRQNGYLDEAIRDFETVLEMKVPERGFDFSRDYEVRKELGLALFDRGKSGNLTEDRRRAFLERARREFQRVLEAESEDTTAHYNLSLIAGLLGDQEAAASHLKLFDRYRVDNNAADAAQANQRQKNPAANHAAQSIVIYDLAPRT